jgi:hypothetical protein
MSTSSPEHLTEFSRYFLEPSNATHRQYEALRAHFVEGLRPAEVARRFGYTPGSFRVLCSEFRGNPKREFFAPPRRGPQSSPKSDPVRERVIALRKENLSIYDISDALAGAGQKLSPGAVSVILKEEGFAKLPRRRDEERPPGARAAPAQVSDARMLDLSPAQFRTKFGGLFLFLRYLVAIPLDQMLADAKLPGSMMVPASHAVRSLLALKLFGNARHSHVMGHVFDRGLALFAGLNTIPKRAFMTEYSCRVDPRAYPVFMRRWFDAVDKLGLDRGTSFDLDFHTIPFHGDDALLQKHYVSKRSRRQKGVLAFLAQDADTRVFCYGNAELRKEEQNDEVLRFVDYWKDRTGNLPEELVFDSKLTTYKNLNQLNDMGVRFMTLRRRTAKMLEDIRQTPTSAWRRIELRRVTRAYRRPRILDEKISLRDYEGLIRQLTIADLGHDDPTILLTNQIRCSAPKLIERYAQRMVIENGIADSIDFFHMDALSSAVAMKVNLDLQLTLMASSLYRLLGAQIGREFAQARSRTIFRHFVDAVANITLTKDEVIVKFQKRAHNPHLLAAGFAEVNPQIPWLDGKRLRFQIG